MLGGLIGIFSGPSTSLFTHDAVYGNTWLYDFEVEGPTTMQPLVVGNIAIEVRALSRDHDAYVLEEHFKKRKQILE